MQAQSSQTTGSRKDLGFARQVRESGKGMAELNTKVSELWSLTWVKMEVRV